MLAGLLAESYPCLLSDKHTYRAVFLRNDEMSSIQETFSSKQT